MVLKLRPILPVFLIALALRMLLPWVSHGFVQMDEHWQVIEPANSLLGHPWSQAVEWKEGLRNWIYPWFVSLTIRMAEKAGFSEPIWINSFVRMIHGLISSLSIFLIYFGLFKAQVEKKWARLAALFIALWPFAIYCSFHTHGEMLGALLVAAATLIPAWNEGFRGFVASGFCFGLALALKIDVAVAGLGYGLYQLFYGSLKARISRATALVIGVLPWVVLVGLTDKLAWGTWFHSVLGHAKVNLVDAVGNQWGVSPWYFHWLYFFDMGSVFAFFGTLALPFIFYRIKPWMRAMIFMNVFFIFVFSTIEHKEKRFMSPLLYTGFMASMTSLYLFVQKYQARFKFRLKKSATIALLAILAFHFIRNADLYLWRQPFANRILAMKKAGEVPGIQAMFSPQWPAVFYLPRNVHSAIFESNDPQYIEELLKPYTHISIAVDWGGLWPVENHGFHCAPWPTPKPPEVAAQRDVPWAYTCTRISKN